MQFSLLSVQKASISLARLTISYVFSRPIFSKYFCACERICPRLLLFRYQWIFFQFLPQVMKSVSKSCCQRQDHLPDFYLGAGRGVEGVYIMILYLLFGKSQTRAKLNYLLLLKKYYHPIKGNQRTPIYRLGRAIFPSSLQFGAIWRCYNCDISIVVVMMNEQAPSALQLQDGKPYVGYVKDSDYYFDGYSHFSIHEEMLKDTIRTKSYMKAIVDNPELFKDKVVLDVGSGTGILSIFAAKSGARHVYGIEKASIHAHSRNIIAENGLSDRITIITGLVEEITLPVEQVDIIISEWMGYFLLYESMFDSVIYARNKWLRPGGILMPNRAKMYLAVLDDEAYYHKKLSFWNNVYGISMKCMKKWVLSEPIVDPIDHQDILSNSFKFYDIDLETIQVGELDFNSTFRLNIELDGVIHGFVSWFDCDFSHGKKKITLSTSPYKKQTHWKQTVFYIDKPVQVLPGDFFEGNLNVSKAKENPRQLNVRFQFKVGTSGEKSIQFYRIS